MYNYKDINTVHLEVTQRCNASCPMCDRNENGGAVNQHIKNNLQELSLDDCINIFDPDFLQQLKVLYMCGNLGDPISAKDTLEIFDYTRAMNDNIWLSMNTNAGARDVTWWRELAKEWGVEKFMKKKTGRFVTSTSEAKETHQAKNRKGVNMQQLAKPKKAEYQNLALLKQKEIEKTYGGMKNYYDSCDIKCKVAGKDPNIFITAEGLVLPCCWTAGRMYKWWHKDPKVEQIWDFIDAVGGKEALDARIHGVEGVFETGIMQDIQRSWNKKSIEEGKLGVCSMKCGTEFDPFAEQFT